MSKEAYFLKNKLDAFKDLKEFKPLAKKQSDEWIETLRFDNGGKYTYSPQMSLLISCKT